MTCVIVYGLRFTYREILGFWALFTVFRVFRERFLRVRICMGLLYSFRVWGLFLGFHDFLIVLVSLERECSVYFYRLAVRWEEEIKFFIWGLHCL